MGNLEEIDDPMEQAIAQRLQSLSALPVDTSRLDAAIRAQIPALQAATRNRRIWRPIAAIAATLLIVAGVAIVLMGREAQASPSMMAQMHLDMVSGKIPTMRADNIDDANRAIAAMAGNFPRLPEPPASHTMACCMKNVGNKRVACILLDNGGTPVTMVVADAADVQSPHSAMVVRNGVTYHVQSVNDLQMVMTERGHCWVCLIGATPADKLMDLADHLKF
jgi:hypothetical protein